MPGRMPSGPSRQMSVRDVQAGDENEVSLAQESRSDFPEVSLQLLDPSEWTLAAYGGFCREEKS